MIGPVDRTYNLLCADADSVECVTITSILGEHRHDVTACRDGQTALRLLREREFDLALVDLDLPKLNGFEIIARCRRSSKLAGLPILILADAIEDEACDRAFSLGATICLAKPLSLPMLAHSVWYVLRNKARDKEIKWMKSRLDIESNRQLAVAN